MKKTVGIALSLILFAFNSFSQTYYVDAAKADNTGTGTSWATAKKDIQAGIDLAAASTGVNKQVWVRKGAYLPTSGYITMKPDVAVFGGFSGTETVLADRNWITNTTTLDGGGGQGVVYANGSTITNTSILNGFTITLAVYSAILISGGSSPTIENCRIVNNGGAGGSTGAGISINSSAPIINNCFLDHNIAGQDGGGINIDGGSPTITNCLFMSNSALNGWGGAINCSSSGTPTITNCTFFANSAPRPSVGRGGAIVSQGSSSVTIYNSIIWGNTSGKSDPNIYGAFTINNSLIEGGYTGVGNIDSIPNFVNSANLLGADGLWGTADDGLRLSLCSPAINSGNNSYIPVNNTKDLGGSTRVQFTNVDMGAYENNVVSLNTGGLPNTQSFSLSTQSGTVRYYDACNNLVSTISSTGSSPISGSTTAKVWVETNQPRQFVKRHYEITPASNATTATGKVTLYFTQQDFDDFNNQIPAPALLLPTGPNDATGIGNLRIEKRPGISSDGSGTPNTYTGTPTTLQPLDNNIVWDPVLNRWEIDFGVNGFSGFFVKTQSTPLPVSFGDINAVIKNGALIVNWQTLTETNNDRFEIEASQDGINFTKIATIASKAEKGNSSSSLQYSWETDLGALATFSGVGIALLMLLLHVAHRYKKQLLMASVVLFIAFISCSKRADISTENPGGKYFIRIVQVDKDGGKTYSKIVSVVN